MFKNLTLLRATSLPTLDAMREALSQEEFSPCGATHQKATGWVPPRETNGALIESAAGNWIAKFAIETKAVPADALRRRVDELAAQIEQTTGRTPGRRERKDLRDDALQELLPHAFPRTSHVWVWIDPESGLLAVDASSMGKVDEVTTSLTRIMAGKFAMQLIQSQITPQSAMTAWLSDGEVEIPSCFALGRACGLKGDGEQPATVKFKKHDLLTDEVCRHVLDGKLPIALALNWEDRVQFTLTDALMLKGIDFDDAVFADHGDSESDRFDTDVAIKCAELWGLIDGLLDALGGELEVPRGGANAG